MAGSRDARRESCPALFDPHFPNSSTEQLSPKRPSKRLHSTRLPCPLPLCSYPQGPTADKSQGFSKLLAPWIGQRRPSVSAGPRGGWPWGLERLKESGGLPPRWYPRLGGQSPGPLCSLQSPLYMSQLCCENLAGRRAHFTGKKHQVWTRHQGSLDQALKAWNRKTQNSSL